MVKLVNLLIAQSQKKFCEVSYAVINLGLSFDCECTFQFCTAAKAKSEVRKSCLAGGAVLSCDPVAINILVSPV